ncbi:type VI secretion system protein ImpK [Moraxella cuniculi DSM 21768]|uniref:Type VI secretion system protein ImpK n=1 Tax=Moraxella cuniculi DSM 21768 TaxID=1122245 RepID=A0A1N7G9R6_9GAMM|nr:type VI secretion system protein TssL, long form [Moraxella cuniculi]OOS06120.1 cell envelope biogenesis protein OmpA [Moraxella cuniculi]SIS09311.1 type VI secretion system protein ImpK [Moraxella cuniculi DSM 21768]
MNVSINNISSIYNPLLEAAKPLLILANSMKNSTSRLSIDEILHKFSAMIGDFEEQAENNDASYESTQAAKYCLCTFIDEMAANSGWADESWAQKSLLVSFFDETWGGERFFEIAEQSKKNPEKNLYLLELIYVCLQFGYKGKYRILPNGDFSLEKIQNELLKIIEGKRPSAFSLLLTHQKKDEDVEQKKRIKIPLWVFAVFTGLIIGGFYLLLSSSLGKKFDKVSGGINALSLPKPVITEPIVEKEPVTRLRPVLKHEIDNNLVDVQDLSDNSIITIRGDGLFESGSEQIQDEYYPVLATIGQALNNTEGQIIVTGYTDSTPIKSVNYPSNWQLSQARADSVKETLLKYIEDDSRIRSEGRGDNNPVAPNDSSENKAKNRRVEIALLTTGIQQ